MSKTIKAVIKNIILYLIIPMFSNVLPIPTSDLTDYYFPSLFNLLRWHAESDLWVSVQAIRCRTYTDSLKIFPFKIRTSFA